MASPDPPPLNSKQHPDFARVLGPASPAMEPQGAIQHRRAPRRAQALPARVAAASYQAAWANR